MNMVNMGELRLEKKLRGFHPSHRALGSGGEHGRTEATFRHVFRFIGYGTEEI